MTVALPSGRTTVTISNYGVQAPRDSSDFVIADGLHVEEVGEVTYDSDSECKLSCNPYDRLSIQLLVTQSLPCWEATGECLATPVLGPPISLSLEETTICPPLQALLKLFGALHG